MLNNVLLNKVNRPARYIGSEWNSVSKDWDKTDIHMVLAYPDCYEIGMSNMAVPILYSILNQCTDVLAERVYTPWVDMETVLRDQGLPLFSLETKHPLNEFDIIGFSLGYELTYTNVLNMLDLAQIPLLSSARSSAHPLVIAGGTCALNPEPMSDFIDAFCIGDGEDTILEFLEVYRTWKRQSADKDALLCRLAAIPGIYVPSLYRADYLADGALKSVSPTTPEAPPKISRRILTKLPPSPTHPPVPYIEVVHDRGAIEVQRGCSRGCRFCQAGMIYRPVRERPHEEVMQAAGELIDSCGYDELSLVSLNTSDYSGINELIASLAQQHPRLSLSLPSLRLDTLSINLVESLPTRSRTGLTFAPEAGSERLRQAINKNISDASLMETAAMAFERGWSSLKLYFMVGLPTETIEDVQCIVDLVDKVRAEGKHASGKKPTIRVSVSTFVPKPHTPFQWSAQDNEAVLKAKLEILQKGLTHKGTKLSWQDPNISLLEATLSRGDRRLGKVIYRAWELGCKFDAWSEHFKIDRWLRAFADTGIDPAFYAKRERSLEEILPWSHIDIGVSEAFLKKEYERARQELETPDCRNHNCNACGLQSQQVCQLKIKAC